MLTVFRVLFYQLLIVTIIVSCVFLYSPVYWGHTFAILEKAYKNIFHQVEYDDFVRSELCSIGRARCAREIFDALSLPENVTIVKERIFAEEWYQAILTIENADGSSSEILYSVRIHWKPWEYYYKYNEIKNKSDNDKYNLDSDYNNRWTRP